MEEGPECNLLRKGIRLFQFTLITFSLFPLQTYNLIKRKIGYEGSFLSNCVQFQPKLQLFLTHFCRKTVAFDTNLNPILFFLKMFYDGIQQINLNAFNVPWKP